MGKEDVVRVLGEVEKFLGSKDIQKILVGVFSNEELSQKIGIEIKSVSNNTKKLRDTGEIHFTIITNDMRRAVNDYFSNGVRKNKLIRGYTEEALELLREIVEIYPYRNKLYLHSAKPIKLLIK